MLELKLIVVLEMACIELVHAGHGRHELLEDKKHRKLLERAGRECNADMRPDIPYQCLKALLSSPANQAGRLKIYIRTQHHVLIEVSPQLMPPATFREFESVFGTLLVRKNVESVEKRRSLLRIIKNDLSAVLPPSAPKIGLEIDGSPVANLTEFISEKATAKESIVFFIGAVAHSSPASKKMQPAIEMDVRLGDRPLTAAHTCHLLCAAFESLILAESS